MDKRVKWLTPDKGILHDIDGTLTASSSRLRSLATSYGPNTYVTPYWKHNEWPECTVDLDLFSGIVCPHPWSIRRIVFYAPNGNINKKTLNLWQYDDDIVGNMTEEELAEYLVTDNASEVAFKEKESPMFHWAMPYVTGHKYYARWNHGLDFENVSVMITPWLWDNEDDGDVEFTLPHYETRAAVYFDSSSGRKANNTINTVAEDELVMGNNVVYNETETREMEFIVNGRDGSDNLKITGHRCVVDCAPYIAPVVEEEVE